MGVGVGDILFWLKPHASRNGILRELWCLVRHGPLGAEPFS